MSYQSFWACPNTSHGIPTDCRKQRCSSGIVSVPCKKEGVEAVSGRIQVLAAEMGEVIRSMAERELQLQKFRSDCHVARSPPRGGVN